MNNSVLIRFLDEAIDNRRILSVTRGHLGKGALRGFVVAHSEEVTVLHRIDEAGRDNGLTVVRTADIKRVLSGPHAAREKLALSLPPRPALPPEAMLSMSAALTVLVQQFGPVAVFTENDDDDFTFARDLEVDEDHVRLALFDPVVRHEACIPVEEITRLDADGPWERLTIAGLGD